MNPKISVVVPLYNGEKYVVDCINSILDQTFKDIEIVIVDDKSTDNSFEIVRRNFCNKSSSNYDQRVKLFQSVKNSGYPGGGYNKGLQLTSESKYIYFMDDDDVILKNCLQHFYDAAEEIQSDVVYMNSNWTAVDPNFKLPGKIDASKATSSLSAHFMSENLIDRLQRYHINIE